MGSADVADDRRRERWLVAFVVLGSLGAIGTWMSWASFSVTTSNEGNVVSAGTVSLGNDAFATPLYDVADRTPGSSLETCIAVTYEGTLPADVKLYSTPVGSGDQLMLRITLGSGGGGFPDCTGFVPAPTGAVLFDDSLADFARSHGSWDDGLALPPPTVDGWQQDDRAVLRFVLEQSAAPEHFATGAHTYLWEARNR